ncbi:MAG: sugar phosphate isomerase/epimerase [Deltaproteobacteria bacterium]|nr:sugar phosphate isomerase/epimerase [Deltaproteobacteria bacterium]
MRLSFSTNAFVNYPVSEAVEKIGAIGYEGVELLADAPHLYTRALKRSDIDELKAAVSRAGVKVCNINANTVRGCYGSEVWDPLFEPSLSNPDPVARAWMAEYVKKCIDLAFEVGSPNISVNSGKIMPDTAPEDALGIFKDSLREVLAHAATKGVRIGVEYEPGLLIESCEELSTLIYEIGSPLLGANLDLGHSHVMGEDPETVARSLSGRVFHIHAGDIKGRDHFHLIPGLGDMNFRSILKLYDNGSYKGYFTVELYTCPDEPEYAAKEAFNFLKGIKL